MVAITETNHSSEADCWPGTAVAVKAKRTRVTQTRHPNPMFPFELLSPEASAVNLLEQVHWREGLCCPHCRSKSVIKHGSYREYQRYLCKDCDRTFNDKTGTIFADAKIGLDKLFVFYSFLRYNTSIRQLDAEIDV